jgi:predicted GIY-YIG superfamily endonuclease
MEQINYLINNKINDKMNNKNNNNKKSDKYYCYIIRSTNPNFSNSTYNGSTNNLVRRLRQHNGELVGGAKATKGKEPWEYFAIWDGFDSKIEALSCEWRIKHPTNTCKRPSQYNGVKGRVKSLNLLTGLDNWTSKSTGMGIRMENEYNLYITDELIGLIDLNTKKENLKIKKLIYVK